MDSKFNDFMGAAISLVVASLLSYGIASNLRLVNEWYFWAMVALCLAWMVSFIVSGKKLMSRLYKAQIEPHFEVVPLRGSPLVGDEMKLTKDLEVFIILYKGIEVCIRAKDVKFIDLFNNEGKVRRLTVKKFIDEYPKE